MRRSLLTSLVALAGLASGMTAAVADCTCRSQGRDFELGQNACLQTPKGARIATCGMVLNNTSWQFTDMPCVVSQVPPQGEGEPARAAAHDHHHHAHHRHGG